MEEEAGCRRRSGLQRKGCLLVFAGKMRVADQNGLLVLIRLPVG